MTKLSTIFMGLELKSPVIVASSGLTNNIFKIKEFAQNGAGAIVLKSLFEEQIVAEADKEIKQDQTYGIDVQDYISRFKRDNTLGDYLKLIKDAKEEVDIPIIASINCKSDEEWTSFASEIEKAGADGIEINISHLPSNPEISGAEAEEMIFKIAEKVNNIVDIPISLKISNYSAGLASLIRKLSWSGYVDAIVLFNRYYSPDIDIDSLKIVPSNVYSKADEISTSLRWIALMRKHIEDVSLVATTGVHDGEGVVKQVLAGADAVQIASVLYQNGASVISEMNKFVEDWMNKKNHKKLDDFRGILSYDKDKNTSAFERIQFMKHFGGIE